MFAQNTCRFLRYTVGKRITSASQHGRCLLVTNTLVVPPILRCESQYKRTIYANVALIRKAWKKMFSKYLLATNTVTSGILMVVGDFIAQEFECQRRNDSLYDLGRAGRMFITGLLLGPLHHYIYIWMDHIMPIANFSNSIRKILLDQFLLSPLCIVTFFYSSSYLEGKTLTESNQEFVKKVPYTYLMDWMMWPAAQYVNFRYLPSKYRVIFVNFWTALYNIGLSYIKHDFETIRNDDRSK